MAAIDETDVIICGAGAGGLVLALELGRRGISVRLVERSSGPPMPRRAENLQPNGLRILDQLGLLGPLMEAGACRNEQFHFVSIEPAASSGAGGGRAPLCTIDYRDLPGPYPYTVITTPAVMQPLLLKALGECSSVRCDWGRTATALAPSPAGLAVSGIDMDGSPWSLRARMVVGADGALSTVRQAAGIAAAVHHYRDGYVTALLPRPAGMEPGGRYGVGRGEIAALFPVSASEVALLYMVRRAQWPAIKAGSLEAFKGQIVRAEPLTADPLRSVTAWDDVGFMPCVRVRARRWVDDRVALLGDAAHAMNPHVAQGRNQAMVDAVALAETIADGLERGDLSRTALARYEAARRPVVERLQRTADELTLFWNNDWWPLGWMRERVFRTLASNRRLRGRMTALVAGLPVGGYSWVERCQAAGFLPDWRADDVVHHEWS